MLLRTRVTLLMLLAALVMSAAFGLALWQRNRQLTERYHESLTQGQQFAWNRLEARVLETLQGGALNVLRQARWLAAWRERERATALGAQFDQLLSEHPGWRIDVFDARRRRVYSSAAEVDPAPMLDAGWLSRAVPGSSPGEAGSGLIQVTRDQYFWVHAEPFGRGDQAGVLAVGVRVDLQLAELAGSLGGDVYLLNLRGRLVAGTGAPELFARPVPGSARGDRVWTLPADDGRVWLAVSQQLNNTDQRAIGALVSLRDISARTREDLYFTFGLIAAGVAFAMVFFSLLYAYLRAALEPLGRAVEVLGALSRGDLDISLDEGDELPDDEAGRIGRGVAALRRELLHLQMLREERARIRLQQEQLIREQLKALAESLDAESRAEILRALEADPAAVGSRRHENHLAELAGILSRMSGLVTHQQARLLKLLKELQTAMENQALLASLQQELDIARTMQLSILPRGAPLTDAVDVAATMIPARDVGGDFYDYFLIDADHLGVVIADVSGKGVPAAFFMAISRTLLKSNVLFLRRPADVIAQLNDQLYAENEQMMFVTMFFGVLDLRDGSFVYVNAGHHAPVLLPHGQAARMLPSGQNMALAVASGIVYREGSMVLQQDDTLFLYTDGVTEAVNSADDLFGTERLLAVLESDGARATELPGRVIDAVRQFEQGCPQADDITCVVVRYRGGHNDLSRTVPGA